jgi:DNA-binding GntR family transcriptional regulator
LKKQKNLTLSVYYRIKQMMFNYDIVPSQRLVFVDLAKQLGVSRTPVNSALCILAKEGYLDFVPNQGYSVHKLTLKEAEALYEVREILEVGTVEKALRKMTPAMLKELEKRKNDYKKAITNQVQRKMFVLDTAFHAGIIEMVENPTLTERYWDICQKIFLRFRVEDLKVERIRDITKEHQELFEAVKAKDVELTKALIRAHHSRSRENLFAIIFKNEKENVKLTDSHPSENWAY